MCRMWLIFGYKCFPYAHLFHNWNWLKCNSINRFDSFAIFLWHLYIICTHSIGSESSSSTMSFYTQFRIDELDIAQLSGNQWEKFEFWNFLSVDTESKVSSTIEIDGKKIIRKGEKQIVTRGAYSITAFVAIPVILFKTATDKIYKTTLWKVKRCSFIFRNI